MDKHDDNNWLLKLISLGIGAYFIVVFHINEGFPPCTPIENDNWVFLFLGIFLLLLPFAKRLKIGQLFEIEREIKTVQETVSDFKDEMRNTVSVLSSSVNTISTATNQVTVNIPNANDLRESSSNISSLITNAEVKEEEIRDELVLDDEDTILSLAKVRIRLEQVLRQILGKRRTSSGIAQKNIKYMSVLKLFDDVAKDNKAIMPARGPLKEVIQVCNAAVHGQRIPYEEASAAIDLGTNLIAAFEELNKDGLI